MKRLYDPTMPELPEVEIVMRGLEAAIKGRKIKTVQLNRTDIRKPIPQNFASILKGAHVTDLIRRGKYILVFLSNGDGFCIHLGMSGRVRIIPSGKLYAPDTHDHVVFTMHDGTRVIYNDPRRFGMVFLIERDYWQDHPAFCTMGPEPLTNDFSGPVLRNAIKNRKGPIKNLLLDQHIVAGIGNIYAAEALFESGIHPQTPGGNITKAQAELLSQTIKSVLKKAIKAGGSSLKDYRHTDDGLGYFQHQFSVYDREREKCGMCDCNISKTGGVKCVTMAGRSTYYCPVKQKMKKLS
jgi:formamidopyrimidine-DNA glycosylase